MEMAKMNARLGMPRQTAWRYLIPRAGQDPNHSTPYLDVIIPPCAAICLFISMYAVLGIGLDWQSGHWRGDLLILLLAVGLPLVLVALRHWRRWRACGGGRLGSVRAAVLGRLRPP
jgi:hypothetical protein